MQRVWRISPKLSKIIQKLFFMFIAFGVCNLRRGVSWDDCVTGMLAYHGMQTAEDTKPFGLQTAKGFIRVYFLKKKEIGKKY